MTFLRKNEARIENSTGITLGNNISFTPTNMSFGGNVLHNVGTGTAVTDAVNLGQMNEAVQNAVNNIRITAGEGIQVTRNSAGNFTVATNLKGSPARSQMLGGNICFRGDENITTAIKAEDVDGDGIADGTKIKLNLNKDINLGSEGSVTTGNTVINNNGVSVGGNTYVSSDVLNANDQTITNVKAGRIAEGSTDAVNGGQLFVTDQAVIGLSHDVNKLGARLNRVGAGAAALAALHPLDFDPDAKWDFTAGYGNYRNASAVAVGTYYRPNEDTMFSVGGSFGGGENMVNAGVSLKIGAGNSNVSTSRVAMTKEIKSLKEEVENLRSALVDVAAGKQIDPLKTKLFPDIPENHWAYKAVAALAGNGMIEGYPDGKFGGDRMMTRYEMATIIYNAMQRGAKVNAKLFKEFEPEMEYIRIDTVHQDQDGQPTVQRVRVNR